MPIFNTNFILPILKTPRVAAAETIKKIMINILQNNPEIDSLGKSGHLEKLTI